MVVWLQELPVGDIKDVLTVTDVTVAGILLGIVIFLLWDRHRMIKKHDQQVKDINQVLKNAQERLNEASINHKDEVKEMAEKYYTVTTEVLLYIKTLVK